MKTKVMNEQMIKDSKGGWNCRHQMYGVADYMVPDSVKQKLEEKITFVDDLENNKQLKDSAEHINKSKAKYNSYGSEWEKAYFDKNSGGFNVYHKNHRFTEEGWGGKAEKEVGKILAKYNGKQVEFLPEGTGKQPDVKFDSQTWDIKYINNSNEETIRSAIRDARKADNAIFYFTQDSKYLSLNSAIDREVGRFLKGQIDKLPDIYVIDKNRHLKLLWEKKRD